MTRVNEAKRGLDGNIIYTPEKFFRFVSVYFSDPDEEKILLVLQKDREARKIWTPVGGEIEIPNTAVQQAIKEAKEEINVDVDILYLLSVHERYDNDSPYMLTHDAHIEIIEFHGLMADGQTPECAKQPEEPEYEIVDLHWFDIEELNEALEIGTIKVYPNVLQACQKLFTAFVSQEHFFQQLKEHKII